MREVAGSTPAESTLIFFKGVGWQNGYCAAFEMPWEQSHAGSNPAPTAFILTMLGIFKKSKKPENAEEIMKEWKKLDKRLADVERELEILKKDSSIFVRSVGLVRYDAFSQTGGKQSFSLALLDGETNGAVVTGLFKEGETRVYVKKIKEGECERTLSPEEEEAVKKAKE